MIVGDTDLMTLDDEAMRKARLSKIAYIPQGAMNSLNPVMRIGAQMLDAVKSHMRRRAALGHRRSLHARAEVGRSRRRACSACTPTSSAAA